MQNYEALQNYGADPSVIIGRANEEIDVQILHPVR